MLGILLTVALGLLVIALVPQAGAYLIALVLLALIVSYGKAV